MNVNQNEIESMSGPTFRPVMQESSPAKINPTLINALYLALIPMMFFMLIDKFLFDEAARKILPQTFEQIIWFNLVFNFPHIVCSTLIILQVDNLKGFKKELSLFAVGIAIFMMCYLLFLSILFVQLIVVLGVAWTVKHVIGQQFSITRIFLRCKDDYLFKCWKYYSIGIAFVFFLDMYAMANPLLLNFALRPLEFFKYYAVWFSLPAFLLSIPWFKLALKNNNANAIKLIIGNNLLILFATIFYSNKYYCLAVLAPRIIHDLSAFYFYGVYSYNKRNHYQGPSFLSVINKYQPIPLLLSSSLIAISLMHVFVSNGLIIIFSLISIFHFYTESFFWKSSSPSKEFIYIK